MADDGSGFASAKNCATVNPTNAFVRLVPVKAGASYMFTVFLKNANGSQYQLTNTFN